jgi:hypothetical protein
MHTQQDQTVILFSILVQHKPEVGIKRLIQFVV